VPTGKGEHAVTDKVIEPMAPAFNPQRFTDAAKVEKWFRRNPKTCWRVNARPAKKPMC
jgi:hypothetical protein